MHQFQQESQQQQIKITELKNSLWESQQNALQLQDEVHQLQQLSIIIIITVNNLLIMNAILIICGR